MLAEIENEIKYLKESVHDNNFFLENFGNPEASEILKNNMVKKIEIIKNRDEKLKIFKDKMLSILLLLDPDTKTDFVGNGNDWRDYGRWS